MKRTKRLLFASLSTVKEIARRPCTSLRTTVPTPSIGGLPEVSVSWNSISSSISKTSGPANSRPPPDRSTA